MTGSSLNAFGLAVEADFPLPGASTNGGPHPGRKLSVRRVPQSELLPLVDEPRTLRYLHTFDGCPYAMLEGAEGDMLIAYGFRGLFHLSADARLLRCAPAAEHDPAWQRVLLDTVLWTVSLLRGFVLLHASAVQTTRGVVAFVGVTGGGKTSLAAEFLRRGATLFCDDILALEAENGRVHGHPGPPVMNLPSNLVGDVVGEPNVLADFGDERWVRVDAAATSSQPVAAVVLVMRSSGLEAACTPIAGTHLQLLAHTVGMPHLDGYVRERFELVATLASAASVLELRADPSVPTETLADLVMQAMEER